MRLVSYNILNGGEGRADPLAEVIEAQRPDLVALIEADDLIVVDRIARRLGFDRIHAAAEDHAVALLSRWPIVQTINHGGFSSARPTLGSSSADAGHSPLPKGAPPLPGTQSPAGDTHHSGLACLLEAVVQPPRGEILTVGVFQFRAPDQAALAETAADRLLEVFSPCRNQGERHLLLGNVRFEQDPASNGLPGVLQRLLDAGYVDCGAEASAAAGSSATYTTQHPQCRRDFILGFGNPALRVRRAWVERDRLAKYASDHFPIGAELD